MNTTTVEMNDVKFEVQGNDEDKHMPHYPEGILPENKETDPPMYQGDMNDMTERLRFKLFQIWNTWSSLHSNEVLVKKLALNKNDSEDVQYIKACIVLLLDRLGKILSNTEIVPEMRP
jgi:hypothetical protein